MKQRSQITRIFSLLDSSYMRSSDPNAPQVSISCGLWTQTKREATDAISFILYSSASEYLKIQITEINSPRLSLTIIKSLLLCLYVTAVHAKAGRKAATVSQLYSKHLPAWSHHLHVPTIECESGRDASQISAQISVKRVLVNVFGSTKSAAACEKSRITFKKINKKTHWTS